MGPKPSQRNDKAASREGNRRQGTRRPKNLGLTFSGVVGRHMLIGEGEVTDLSHEGAGIRGNRAVQPGMDVALFIEIPGSEEHICVPEARVSWVRGERFGVTLRTVSQADRRQLGDL